MDEDDEIRRTARERISGQVQSGLTHEALTKSVIERASSAFDPRNLVTRPLPAATATKTIKLNQQLNERLNGDAERKAKEKTARILNAYKKTYAGKIEFVFPKAAYTADMDSAVLDAHLAAIRLCNDTVDVPFAIEAIIKKTAAAIAFLAKIATIDIPGVSFDELEDSVSKAIAKGEFKEEVTQLSIEYQDWFALGPIPRTLRKITQMAQEELDASTTNPGTKTSLKSDDL